MLHSCVLQFDTPSLACTAEGKIFFYEKLLGYVFLPLIVVLIMALPSIWAKLKQHKKTEELFDLFLVWALVVVNILYESSPQNTPVHPFALS